MHESISIQLAKLTSLTRSHLNCSSAELNSLTAIYFQITKIAIRQPIQRELSMPKLLL